MGRRAPSATAAAVLPTPVGPAMTSSGESAIARSLRRPLISGSPQRSKRFGSHLAKCLDSSQSSKRFGSHLAKCLDSPQRSKRFGSHYAKFLDSPQRSKRFGSHYAK